MTNQQNITATLNFTRTPLPSDYMALTVTLDHCNAIKIVANLLLVAIRQMDIKLYLVNFIGGSDDTSDPTDAEAKIVIPKGDEEKFRFLVTQCNSSIQSVYGTSDDDELITVYDSVWHAPVVNEEGTHVLLAAINGIPVGKTNGGKCTIAMLEQSSKDFTVSCYIESDDEDSLTYLSTNITQIFSLIGAKVTCK